MVSAMLRYVYYFLLFFFLFRIVRIRRRRKVHVRYISSADEFLVCDAMVNLCCILYNVTLKLIL